MATDATDPDSLRREILALGERVEELASRVRVLGPARSGDAQVAAPRPSREAAYVAEQASADAAVSARLRAELTSPHALAAMRFEGVLRTVDGGVLSWMQSNTLSRHSGAAAAHRMGRVLSALGSEARLKLMLLLWDEGKSAQELAQGSGITTGSLYHHMRELMAVRWVDAPKRNRYVLMERGRKALVMAWALAQAFPPDASDAP